MTEGKMTEEPRRIVRYRVTVEFEADVYDMATEAIATVGNSIRYDRYGYGVQSHVVTKVERSA